MTTAEEGPTDYEEKEAPKFTFKAEDGTLISVPQIGEVNCIALEQENRTDWLFTKLPKELALKYSSGDISTRHGSTKGDKCVVVLKFRGEGIDQDDPDRSGECYTLLFTPYYAERNANLEEVDEDISDDDIKKALLALDESKGLEYRARFLRERAIRVHLRDYYEAKHYDFRGAVTRAVTTVVDDVDLGERGVKRDIGLFSMNTVTKWLTRNKWAVLILLMIAAIIISLFGG